MGVRNTQSLQTDNATVLNSFLFTNEMTAWDRPLLKTPDVYSFILESTSIMYKLEVALSHKNTVNS